MELYNSAAMTFEDLAFMLASSEAAEMHSDAQYTGTSSVGFSGRYIGTLFISAYGSELLPSLTANMLGDFEPPTEQQQRDALGEVANVICGNVLPAITSPQDVFDLDAPQFSTELVTPDSGTQVQVSLPLDEGRVDIVLSIMNVLPA